MSEVEEKKEILTKKQARIDKAKRMWYRFSRNKMSVVGLVGVILVILIAIFQDVIAPYPEHAQAYTNYAAVKLAPCKEYLFGTDGTGRDVLSRIIFSFRNALAMGIGVIGIAAPIGVVFGLLAGYHKGTWISTVIMRVVDIFLSLPSLVLALAVSALLSPTLWHSMMAITFTWWAWYARLVYGSASSVRNEYFVKSAELIGAKRSHIILKEILPNCWSTILTKMTLDMGIVILMGSTLSFVGLGAQPPAPDLGTMISDGYKLLPDCWWLTIFPALAIMFIVLAFNLFGDGISDMLNSKEA